MEPYTRKMYQLAPLYRSMKATGKHQEQFEFSISNLTFEVIFLIDRTPFELLVGVEGTQIAFVLSVGKGFMVSSIPDKPFNELKRLLILSPGENTFTSWTFLSRLAISTPQECTDRIIQPHDIAKYKENQLRRVADGDKIYFVGWNNHLADGRKARNIEKTRLLCGDAVADFCRENNISSMWSDHVQDANPFRSPDGGR